MLDIKADKNEIDSIKINKDDEIALESLKNLIKGDEIISVLANASAMLNYYIQDINWIGFYINNGKKLVVGPFQGKPACSNINYKDGVLGYTYKEAKTVVINNVHKFEGHIACDSDSNSELVIPLINNGIVKYLLDIDSPKLNRFSQEDKLFLEKAAAIIEKEIFNKTE